MKLRPNPAGGEEQVCGPISAPAEVCYWIPAGPMPGGVHDAGSPCADVPLFTFARSTDDYQIWCADGKQVYLPGNVTIYDSPSQSGRSTARSGRSSGRCSRSRCPLTAGTATAFAGALRTLTPMTRPAHPDDLDRTVGVLGVGARRRRR
jgi:hypothetical protein